MTRDEIIQAIHAERERQDKLHPEWHGDQHGLVVLAEEFGEVAKALYELANMPTLSMMGKYERWKALEEALSNDLEDELIQVGAVVSRWLENR